MKDYKINGSVINVTLENEKVVKVATDHIKKMESSLDITEYDAVMTWLEDMDYLPNEELETLDQHAKANGTGKVAKAKTDKPKTQKERVAKENPTKENIIQKVAEMLQNDLATDVIVENKGKIITFTVGNDNFKLDLTQKRKPKA